MTTTTLQTIPSVVSIDTTNKNISIEAIAALARDGMSCQQIGDALGCSKQNIQQRMADAEDFIDFGKRKDHKFENLQRKIYNSIDAGKHQKSSLLQDVTALGILEDKIRNIRGQATLRIDTFSVTASLSELDKRKSDLLRTITIQPVVSDTDSTKS